MLDSLLNSGYEHQIDCMYGSAIANYLLGEYDKSRNICEAILESPRLYCFTTYICDI